MQHYLLRKIFCVTAITLGSLSFSGCSQSQKLQTTTPGPVTEHGALAVSGNRIVNQHKQPISLAGPSLFWGNKGWFAEAFYHRKTLEYVKNDWNASIVRVAMGVEAKGGLLEDPRGRMKKIDQTVSAAIELGLYVIIDWHSHHAEDYPQEAVDFFTQMAKTYGHYDHVIYEIYNEPLRDVSWSDTIKPYALQVIKAIRQHDPDNLIVVGTPSWSQDVDDAADDPITKYNNIVYTLHFYAGSHGQELRDKAQYALDKGLALMVTEWGTVDADGDGGVAYEETLRWMQFIKDNQLSHCNWSLHNKDEGASIFKPGTHPGGPWSQDDLSETGRFVKSIISNWPDLDAVERPNTAPRP